MQSSQSSQQFAFKQLVPGVFSACLLIAPGTYAEPSPALEQELVKRIKAEIMQELRTSDFLQQQIDAGIQDYITRERESRAKIQAKAEAKTREEEEQAIRDQLQNVRRFTVDRDHIYGNPDATISLIEYSDFECPFCKRFHHTAKDLVDQSDGQVNWVYRHFPLRFHYPGAQKEAEASECAYDQGGNDAFWRYTNTLYERTHSGGKGFALDQLTPLAEEQGLDANAFQECLDSEKFAARIKEDLEEGAKAGITGTPGNILLNNVSGDVVLKVGAHPLAVLKDEIKKILPAAPISETATQPDPADANAN